MGCVAASLFALEPRLLFSALSGMEPILLVALWMSACLALLGGRFVLALLLFGLMPVTRPEAVVILPLSAWAMIGLIQRRGWGLLTVAACTTPVLPALLSALFCHGVTGHWLPNTYYLKGRPFHLGAAQLQLAYRALSQHGWASLWVYLFGLAAWIALFRRGARISAGIGALVLLAAPVAYLLGVVGSRPISLEGYYWTRWLDPASLILTAAFCLGYGAIARLAVQPRQLLAARAGGIAMLLLLAVSLPAFSRSFADRRRQLASDSRCIDVMDVGMAKWIRDHTPRDAVVTAGDAGICGISPSAAPSTSPV